VTEPGRVPSAFGGRGRELRDARTVLEQLAVRRHGGQRILEGLRGVGKTALMAHVRQETEGQGLLTLRAELGGDRDAVAHRILHLIRAITPAGRLRELASRFRGVRVGPIAGELTSPTGGPEEITDLIADLGTTAAANDAPVLLTIDEAHEDPHVACQIIRGLHEAGQQEVPVAAYLAGLPGLHARLSEITTYAERLPVTTLGLLDYDETRAALVTPFADAGILVTPDVVDAVADAAGGYPYFVQLWGHHLWRETADPDRITMAAVRAASGAVQEAVDRLFSGRFDRLTELQRRYVMALARLGGRARSADVASALGRAVQSVSPLRAKLIERGALYAPAYGEVALTVPGLDEWLVRRE
jgi:hypothetical protein